MKQYTVAKKLVELGAVCGARTKPGRRYCLRPPGHEGDHSDRFENRRPTVEPDRVADAHDLPFADAEFDCVILDPPYSDEEAREMYETPPLRPALYTAEAVRVLKEGGWLCLYTDREPRRPPRCNHALRIIVVLRPSHAPRTCLIFQKRKPGMPHYGTEPGEAAELEEAA